MTQISTHIDTAARTYKEYASDHDFTKDFITTEVEEWLSRLLQEGSLRSVNSNGWMLDEKTYKVIYVPADEGATNSFHVVTMVFEHFQPTQTDSLSAYDRAMAGI